MRRIILSKGSALVDDEDHEWLNAYCWQPHKSKNILYARTGLPFRYLMHIAIYRRHNLYDPNLTIDHIDRNGLNNQKQNLQLLTQRENILKRCINSNNTSGFRGVKYVYKGYYACLNANGKRIQVGPYNTTIEAAVMWNILAKIAFGPNAYQNIIPQEENINDSQGGV